MFSNLFSTYESTDLPPIVSNEMKLVLDDYRKYIDNTPTNPKEENPLDVPYFHLPILLEKPEEKLEKEAKIEEEKSDKSSTKPTSGVIRDNKEFLTSMISTYKKVLTDKELDPDYAYMLTASAAIESAYGKHPSGAFNYGGIKSFNGVGTVKMTTDYIQGKGNVKHNQVFRDFTSMEDYCQYVVNLLTTSKRYKDAFTKFTANQPAEMWRYILQAGYGGGSEANINAYINALKKIYKEIKV